MERRRNTDVSALTIPTLIWFAASLGNSWVSDRFARASHTLQPAVRLGVRIPKTLAAVAVSMIALASPRVGQAQVSTVWSVGDGEKIRTDAAPPPPGPISLFGMRNETLSFQIVVRAGGGGARDVSLNFTGLAIGEIQVFREDTVVVHERSHGLVWRAGSAAEPNVPVGSIPDRLVPLSPGAGSVIPPNGQQVFWVDIWIDPSAKPGLHSGSVSVLGDAACGVRCNLKLEVELLDRTMPDEVQARSMVWFSGTDVDERVLGRYYSDPETVEEAAVRKLRLRHYQLARQHRISLFGQHETIDGELDALLSGSAFTEAHGYRGPGKGKGLDVLVLHAYGGELSHEQAATILDETKKYPYLKDVFVYVMDEPEANQWAEINRRAQASRPMPSFVTTMYTAKLEADIFAELAGMYSRENAELGRAAGKTVWIYNGERPFTGSFAIDDVAVSPRVNPWIQYKLGIARWFYWEATYYYDFQGKRGAIDVGKNALNFTNRHGDRVNGDGLLMYPGRDLLFPDSDAGQAGPMPSIRLKNWRRGIEDVEYLAMARAEGFGEQVDKLLEALLPRVVDQVNANASVSFPEDGATWNKARRYLFELLRDGRSELRFAPIERSRPREEASISRFWMAALMGFVVALLLALWLWRSRT